VKAGSGRQTGAIHLQFRTKVCCKKSEDLLLFASLPPLHESAVVHFDPGSAGGPGIPMAPPILFVLLSFLIQEGASAPADTNPLPELNSFLQSIRGRLHSDQFIQSQYTYTERSISRRLNSDGRAKKTETREYEVYPSIDERFTYRRLISNDGKPLSDEEIKKQDNAFDRKRREWENTGGGNEKRRHEAEEKHKEEEALDEAFRLYKFKIVGREELNGTTVIALAFEPRTDYRASTRGGKILSNVRGKAWFAEANHELVLIEAELVDNISFGLGILARLNKGARMVFQRRWVNDEVWLPAESRFEGTGRILALKGFRIEEETTYSEYKKFSVETSVRTLPQKGAVQ
jgi:hypothetical protein